MDANEVYAKVKDFRIIKDTTPPYKHGNKKIGHGSRKAVGNIHRLLIDIDNKDKQSIVDSRKSGYFTYTEPNQSQNSFEYSSIGTPPVPEESFKAFSIFGDSACGEPLRAQQLVIDFTPIEEVDTDYVQKKCSAFWEYIQSQPKMQGLMAEPDLEPSVSGNPDITSPVSAPEEEKNVAIVSPKMDNDTALSVLELIEKRGIGERAIDQKVKQSYCTLGSREYPELASTNVASTTTKVCSCSGIVCKPTCTKLQNVNQPSHKLRAWDKAHPKSMDPPGHPPAIGHCKMQLKLPTFM